jgi:prepilin-type N-terminal cleavage/methylation domain-containing protein
MRKWTTFNRGKDKGFTLVEMLVVIFIIGVLATIVTISFNGINRSSRVNSCKVDFNTVYSASLAFKNDNPDGVPLSTDLYSRAIEGTLFASGYMTPLIDNRSYYTIALNFDSVTKDPLVTVLNSKSVTLVSDDQNKPESACTKI